MKPETVEKWVWVAIYGGMALAMAGLWAADDAGPLGHGLAVLGGSMVAAGAAGIWWRSRMSPRVDPRGDRPRDTTPGAPR